MNKVKHIALVLSILMPVVASAGMFSKKEEAAPAPSCDYASIQGESFTFSQTYPGGEKYGYQSWQIKADISSERLPYEKYVGRSGKLTPEKIYPSYSKKSFHQKAVLENCEEVYVLVFESTPSYGGIYLDSDLATAKKLVGTTIWVNNSEVAGPQELITEIKDVSYTAYNLEALTVSDVVFASYGHSKGTGPFFLKVKKSSGEEGLLKFNKRYFYEVDPLPKGTSDEIKTAIQQQKIKVGMSPEQATLSWGKPKKINKSVGAWGVHEQWVYGTQYLYFENGRLSSFQSSN
jgi:hypothetical protein